MSVFRIDILFNAVPLLAEGLLATVIVSLASFFLAFLIGSLVGIARAESAKARRLLAPYVEVFRGTPLLIQLFFIYYGLPSIGVTMNNYVAGIVGLALNGGAYISEIVRGALYSVEKGQQDAAAALGLSWFQTMAHVIVPQSIRVALPPLVNSFSSLIKDSSLVSVLAITELTRVSQLIYTRTFRAFEVYLAVGTVYFVMIYAVSLLSGYFERKFYIGGRYGR
ncbi:MAG: amino acid ABC transporter permease [Desulfobacterales bacterium]|nr:amino acid ABC transporter permease [Desulfobacterales bacterium]MDD4073860.1 amino acid ABC transporter permease [Desulfobacterales bacterium]MDD4391291.1 amino acid ABC transporter permease [Desulfobacterales bacterium]